MNIVYTYLASPLGNITLLATPHGVSGIRFESHAIPALPRNHYQPQNAILRQCSDQLREYFAGIRQQFTLPIAVHGTPFQQQVWQTLTTIPYGQTWHYQQLATAINQPKACRAVGAANGKNPLSIIVPCHRVITKSGQIGGYAGGVAIKQQLLALEQRFPTL